jgi:HAD superfamily hydrolase (TIGR01549 family)
MNIQAAIFDMDGTLTEPILDFNQIRSEIGIESGDILSSIEAMEPACRKHALEILERHELYAVENSKLNEGVSEVFEILHERNISIGLLTRNTRENAQRIAGRHHLVFDSIVDRYDGPVKPDGYGVLKLCNDFGVMPSVSLVVGDFLHDMQSARAAGAIPVLMKTHQNADDFEPYADYCISHMSELIDLIDKLENN